MNNQLRFSLQKKTALLFLFALLTALSQSSCTTMKKDCQGVRHVKLKNGIYI